MGNTAALPAAVHLMIVGAGFGEETLFVRPKKIWIPMIAHAAFDLTALGISFWDLESKVAHLVFK